jgi:hypothetical protein
MIAVAHVVFGAVWAVVYLVSAGKAATSEAEEAAEAEFNERFERACRMANDLRSRAAGAPCEAGIERIHRAITYAPRARFGRAMEAEELLEALDALKAKAAQGRWDDAASLLENVGRSLTSLGL